MFPTDYENYDLFKTKNSHEEESLPPSFAEATQRQRAEEIRKRESIMGGLLRFEEEDAKGKITEKIFVASEKHLNIKWEEKSIDGFMNFLEEIRDFQYTHDQRVTSRD